MFLGNNQSKFMEYLIKFGIISDPMGPQSDGIEIILFSLITLLSLCVMHLIIKYFLTKDSCCGNIKILTFSLLLVSFMIMFFILCFGIYCLTQLIS